MAVDRCEGVLALGRVRAIMIFSADPAGSCAWWGRLLGLPVQTSDGGFAWLDLPTGVEIGFHPAEPDENPAGASTVPYWSVPDLDDAVRVVVAAGGRHLRGPLSVAPGRRIAQVVDPFGAVVGLDGP